MLRKRSLFHHTMTFVWDPKAGILNSKHAKRSDCTIYFVYFLTYATNVEIKSGVSGVSAIFFIFFCVQQFSSTRIKKSERQLSWNWQIEIQCDVRWPCLYCLACLNALLLMALAWKRYIPTTNNRQCIKLKSLNEWKVAQSAIGHLMIWLVDIVYKEEKKYRFDIKILSLVNSSTLLAKNKLLLQSNATLREKFPIQFFRI